MCSKIYTKAGDAGMTTSGGQTVPKTDPQIHAIGALDELSAQLGVCRGLANSRDAIILAQVQWLLYVIMGELNWSHLRELRPSQHGLIRQNTEILEREIDHITEQLPKLHDFVTANGKSAHFHVARTVCRRAERAIIGLASPPILQFINRLSDYLFTIARQYSPDEITRRRREAVRSVATTGANWASYTISTVVKCAHRAWHAESTQWAITKIADGAYQLWTACLTRRGQRD